jgi:hypothetical protein
MSEEDFDRLIREMIPLKPVKGEATKNLIPMNPITAH